MCLGTKTLILSDMWLRPKIQSWLKIGAVVGCRTAARAGYFWITGLIFQRLVDDLYELLKSLEAMRKILGGNVSRSADTTLTVTLVIWFAAMGLT
ncbi:unnamed protein product [Clonostachys rosea]|uniref:ABC transmembrane type-1 domain-containing protein n=1 Tax=Bionectria ochroleuca TaxID=29856 RepID=A0ABY6UGH1_BIOOC|nr:unnamed protein product [Clonostachys rosea]